VIDLPAAVNVTGHNEPTFYACPRCPWTCVFESEVSWTDRVRQVREHLVSTHETYTLPPSKDGTVWRFPEDFPK